MIDTAVNNGRTGRVHIRISDVPETLDDFLSDIGVEPEQAADQCRQLVREFLEQYGMCPDPIELAPVIPKSTALVVKTASHPWEVLDDESISDVLGQFYTTRRALFMPLGYPVGVAANGSYVQTRDLGSSVEQLVSELADPAIGVLYLQIGPHVKSEILMLLARELRPDIRIIAEFYDMGALFAVDFLADTRGFTQDEIAVTRLAAWAAARSGGAVIQKADGPAMKRLFDTYDSDVFIWNPMDSALRRMVETGQKDEAPLVEKAAVGTRRIAFAGSLSDVEISQGVAAAPSANMMQTLATLMRDDRLSVTIFNAADRRGDGPAQQRFQRVEAWLKEFGDRHTYRPAVPQDQLLDEMGGYDFGFFCVHYANTPVQHVGRFAIPNRVMAYLAAGLPVIVDSQATTVAEWVSDFGAGIAIDPKEFHLLPNKIYAADREKLRAGAIFLCQELVQRNDAARDAMMKLVADWRGVLDVASS